MGQKVNPHGLRVGVIKSWDTQWYANKKEFAANLKEDYDIREFLKKKYYGAAISKSGKIAPYVSLIYHSVPLRFFRFIHNDTITAPEKLYIKNKGRTRYGFSQMRILCVTASAFCTMLPIPPAH